MCCQLAGRQHSHCVPLPLRMPTERAGGRGRAAVAQLHTTPPHRRSRRHSSAWRCRVVRATTAEAGGLLSKIKADVPSLRHGLHAKGMRSTATKRATGRAGGTQRRSVRYDASICCDDTVSFRKWQLPGKPGAFSPDQGPFQSKRRGLPGACVPQQAHSKATPFWMHTNKWRRFVPPMMAVRRLPYSTGAGASTAHRHAQATPVPGSQVAPGGRMSA